jgi:hypothetical protein
MTLPWLQTLFRRFMSDRLAADSDCAQAGRATFLKRGSSEHPLQPDERAGVDPRIILGVSPTTREGDALANATELRARYRAARDTLLRLEEEAAWGLKNRDRQCGREAAFLHEPGEDRRTRSSRRWPVSNTRMDGNRRTISLGFAQSASSVETCVA